MKKTYDVIIIGKGPAGLTSGIYLSRGGKKVLIIGEDNKIWTENVKINNYFGFNEVTGEELMKRGEAQVKNFGARVINDLVVKIKQEKSKKFTVRTRKGKVFNSEKLIICTGRGETKETINNEREYVGKGVSYCIECDAFFFKDEEVFIIGSTERAEEEAINLLNYTKKVTLVTNGGEVEFNKDELEKKGVKVEDWRIEEVIGEDSVTGVKTSKGVKNVKGLFIVKSNASTNEISEMLGLVTDNGRIRTDEGMKTNVPNVWAAGDCTPGVEQISTAVGEGATAGVNALRKE